jgi:septal ring factor EnvC (AmiA/AmiB activator)
MRYFLLLFIACCMSLSAFSQSVKDLKKKQQQAKEKIALTNKLLNETQKNKKTTVSTLSLIKKQITERENLITALNSEISLLENNLQKMETQKRILQARLASLKKEYAGLIYHAYFHKNKNKFNQYLFILSSQSFTQGFRRLRYVEEYSEYRKEQSIQIQQVTTELAAKVQQMAKTKQTKEIVAEGKVKETKHLQADEKNKQVILGELSKKEKTLHAELKRQQRQIAELNNKIDRLITIEIENARKKAEAKRKKDEEAKKLKEKNKKPTDKIVSKTTTKTSTTTPKETFSDANIMTKEETLIAGGFEKNKARLPWPVRGIITGHFGIHPHPVLDHVEVNNKGVYIQTQQNADACAVYEGEVTQVFAIPGNNNAIIVKHGIYRTVYANLTTTYVKIGSMVSTKQRLGKVYVDAENNNKTEIYFMLYKNAALENPELWLSK